MVYAHVHVHEYKDVMSVGIILVLVDHPVLKVSGWQYDSWYSLSRSTSYITLDDTFYVSLGNIALPCPNTGTGQVIVSCSNCHKI